MSKNVQYRAQFIHQRHAGFRESQSNYKALIDFKQSILEDFLAGSQHTAKSKKGNADTAVGRDELSNKETLCTTDAN